MLYYIKCPDGSRYKVRDAVSLEAALNQIAFARATGSVGSRSTQNEAIIGQPYETWPVWVIADVVRVNSDNTEQQPYTEVY